MSPDMHSPRHSSSFTLHNVFTMRCLTRDVHLQKSADQCNRKSDYRHHSYCFKVLSLLFAHTAPVVCGKTEIILMSEGDTARNSEFTAFAKSWKWQHFCPAEFSLMTGNNRKSHGDKLGLVAGWTRTWMIWSFRKVTVTFWHWRYHDGKVSYF